MRNSQLGHVPVAHRIKADHVMEIAAKTIKEVIHTPVLIKGVLRKKEARKDRLHQNYLKRKANGKQKEYEERTRAEKKAQIERQKEQIRAEGSQHRAEGTGKADDDCKE